MAKFNAILIEDEPNAAARTIEALETRGFEVEWFSDATSVLEATSRGAIVDLVVVDRKLPRTSGDVPSNAVGDELLITLLGRYTDVPLVVFSGYTEVGHIQFATGNRGTIQLRAGTVSVDRSVVFEKGQSLEFDRYVASIKDLLESFEDIEVRVDGPQGPNKLDQRLLRRVAFEYNGTSITASALGGGLSGAAVWFCEIFRRGALHARVVVKRQQKRLEPGGFQSLCEARLTAGTSATVTGFCSGFFCGVQQIVSTSPRSLMESIVQDPTEAETIVQKLRAGLDPIATGPVNQSSVEEIAAPYASWAQIENAIISSGLEPPSASRLASSRLTSQHGDLHPANVMISEDQPVLIDFDSQTSGSALLDPVALLLGPLFHGDSSMRHGDWPSIAQADSLMGSEYLTDCPAPGYFGQIVNWIADRKSSERELASVVLAYACRQLKYEDVRSCQKTRERAVALIRWSLVSIDNS